MRRWTLKIVAGTLPLIAVGGVLFTPRRVAAHCDTLDGPVVAAARLAFERGDVTPALRWVRPEDEAEIRAVFERASTVRTLSPEARDVADLHFFETLVRLHRAGEGAPYTGLKPAGTIVEPAIAAADAALETGRADALVTLLTDAVAAGTRQRLAHAIDKRQSAEDSIAAGREFVDAYVELTHYVERIHADATGGADGHGGEEAACPEAAAAR